MYAVDDPCFYPCHRNIFAPYSCRQQIYVLVVKNVFLDILLTILSNSFVLESNFAVINVANFRFD